MSSCTIISNFGCFLFDHPYKNTQIAAVAILNRDICVQLNSFETTLSILRAIKMTTFHVLIIHFRGFILPNLDAGAGFSPQTTHIHMPCIRRTDWLLQLVPLQAQANKRHTHTRIVQTPPSLLSVRVLPRHLSLVATIAPKLHTI